MVSYDAILIHVYWLSQKKNADVTLSFRSAAAVQAAALLFKNSVKKPLLVITGGTIWGNSYPPIGKIMVKELESTYKIPKEKIICLESAFDTNGEIEVFIDVVKKYQWQSIASLAWGKHAFVIKKLYKNRHRDADFLSVEDVLMQFGDTETKKQIKWFLSSRYEFSFALYEYIVGLLLLFDSRYALLEMIAKKTRRKKGPTALLPFLPIDKYDL